MTVNQSEESRQSVSRAISTLSKARYAEISERVEARLGREGRREVERIIKEVMRFDPGATQYNSARKEKVREWRRAKASREGTSTYVATGADKAYARRKVASQVASGLDEEGLRVN
jgi:hypothetical protein